MFGNRIPFLFLFCISLVSIISPQARRSQPFLIVDTSKVVPAETFSTQNIKFLAVSDETGGKTTVFQSTEMPGYKTSWHRHNNSEETFYVLEGTLTVKIGDKTQDLPAGSYVYIARGTPHAQGNLTDKPVRFITTFSPGGIEHFFWDRAALLKTVRPGDSDFETKYRPIREKHIQFLEILGPWNPERTR